MDEIETQQNLQPAYPNRHTAEPDNVFAHVNIKNALLTIMRAG
jgi:hypothetical protein